MDPEIRQLQAEIEGADVVLGVSKTDPTHEAIFYGEHVLRRVVETGKAETLKVLRVPIDFATTDVEALVAIVEASKGSHCYRSA